MTQWGTGRGSDRRGEREREYTSVYRSYIKQFLFWFLFSLFRFFFFQKSICSGILTLDIPTFDMLVCTDMMPV